MWAASTQDQRTFVGCGVDSAHFGNALDHRHKLVHLWSQPVEGDGEWHLAPLQLSGWLTFCSVHTMVQSCERTLVSGAKVVEGWRDYKSTIQVSPLIRAWKFSSVKTSAR